MSDFTQPICDADWINREGSRGPVRIVKEIRTQENCCICNEPTMSGIYIRVDPNTVPYPKKNK